MSEHVDALLKIKDMIQRGGYTGKRILTVIDEALAETMHPQGCECGGFDRTASHSEGEYRGYCAQPDET